MWLLALASFFVCAGMAENVSLSNGLRLRISPGPTELVPDLAPATGNSFYRIYRDSNNLAVFAYELQVDRSSDGKQFQLTAKPALDDFALKFPNADGGKPTPTFSAPIQSPWLATGEKFVVNVPTNPGDAGGGNLPETIDVRVARAGPGAPDNSPNARIRLIGLTVRVAGNVVATSGPSSAVAGRYAMFYIPGRGAYYLSSEPVSSQSFVEAGGVDRTHLKFTIDNENFEGVADAPILLSGETGELWVFHDSQYKPHGSWTNTSTGSTEKDEFFTAAADSLKWWIQ